MFSCTRTPKRRSTSSRRSTQRQRTTRSRSGSGPLTTRAKSPAAAARHQTLEPQHVVADHPVEQRLPVHAVTHRSLHPRHPFKNQRQRQQPAHLRSVMAFRRTSPQLQRRVVQTCHLQASGHRIRPLKQGSIESDQPRVAKAPNESSDAGVGITFKPAGTAIAPPKTRDSESDHARVGEALNESAHTGVGIRFVGDGRALSQLRLELHPALPAFDAARAGHPGFGL